MKKRCAIIAALSLGLLSATTASADDAILAAVLGGSVGAVIGHQVGGQDGAVIGGAVGAVAGAGHRRRARHYYPPRYPATVYAPEPVYAPVPVYQPAPVYYPAPPVRYAPPRVVYVPAHPAKGHGRQDRHSHHDGRWR